MAFITIRIADENGHQRESLIGNRVVLGRASTCDIPIRHTSISREHCALVNEAGTWFVEDLGSANGTVVGSDRIQERKTLTERDIIRIGKVRLTFHVGELSEVRAAAAESKDAAKARDPEQPTEAMRCAHCGVWLSIAHRNAGESMVCARCQHSNVVLEVS